MYIARRIRTRKSGHTWGAARREAPRDLAAWGSSPRGAAPAHRGVRRGYPLRGPTRITATKTTTTRRSSKKTTTTENNSKSCSKSTAATFSSQYRWLRSAVRSGPSPCPGRPPWSARPRGRSAHLE